MRLKILIVGIDLAPLRVADAQGLHRADDDASMSLQIGGGYLNEVGNIEHAKAPVESGAKRFVIGVFRLFERFKCLRANGVGRHEPKHNRKFALKIGVRRDFGRVGGKQGLAAAGRQAQANVGNCF